MTNYNDPRLPFTYYLDTNYIHIHELQAEGKEEWIQTITLENTADLDKHANEISTQSWAQWTQE